METIPEFLQQHILRYNVLAAIAFVAAALCVVLLAVRFRLQWIRLLLISAASLVGLYLGARLFGMIAYATYLYREGVPDSAVTIRVLWENAGVVYYGGLFGFYLSLLPLIRRFLKQPRLAWDVIAVATPLFHTVARIGCYFGRSMVNGVWVQDPCCYGVKLNNAFCTLFWDSRLPTQLIEAAFNLLLFGTLLTLLLTDRQGKRRGKLVMLYLVAYPLFRYGIEFFRDDAVRGGFGTQSFSQIISVLLLLGVGVYILLVKRHVIKPVPPDPAGVHTSDRREPQEPRKTTEETKTEE